MDTDLLTEQALIEASRLQREALDRIQVRNAGSDAGISMENDNADD